MNKNAFISLFILVAAALTSYSQNNFPFQEYEPRTLAELVAIDADTAVDPKIKAKGLVVHGKSYYSAIRVKYTGTSRPVSAEKKALFKVWQGTLNLDEKLLTLIENEYLFKECDREYWIPVQKQVAAYFPKELKSGDTLTLYLMLVGAVRPKNAWESVFLVNEYRYY